MPISPPLPPKSISKDVNILIVEDEWAIAADLEQSLTSMGYNVVAIANNCQEALKLTAQLKPELILMDIRLEDSVVDGIDLTHLITRRHQTPVVYVTAHTDKETLRRSQATSPYGYIVKPFRDVDLLANIETALERYRLEQRQTRKQELQHQVLQQMDQPVIVIDFDSCIVTLNPAAEFLIGEQHATAVGLQLKQVLHLYDNQTKINLLHQIPRAFQQQQTLFFKKETRLIIPKNAVDMPVKVSVIPLKPSKFYAQSAAVVIKDNLDLSMEYAELRAELSLYKAMNRDLDDTK